MQLDYVDLMLIHWPCDNMDDNIATYKQLEKFQQAGRARAIGVSNFNGQMLTFNAFGFPVSFKHSMYEHLYGTVLGWPQPQVIEAPQQGVSFKSVRFFMIKGDLSAMCPAPGERMAWPCPGC